MSTEDGARVGLRERKKRETRATLSWAAVTLTVERGFDRVRVEDIAEAAGVSPRTFNNYFSSKAEAIVARHLDRSLRGAEILRGRPASEPLWESIAHAVRAQFEPPPETVARQVTDPQQWIAGVRVMVAEPALQGEFLRAGALAEAGIAAAVAERTGTDVNRDLYPNLVAAAVTAAVNVTMQHWLRTDPPVEMQRLLSEALAQFAAGLPTP
ncbi:acyl-CoA-like ligand-binding transcription factor [Planotetraspora mira]|jgi:AcrR family transcriptional regulator|uniref:TetR family transcriptional regulator n=1 Tax=Planotetraspora mira TaxID=58121 RepID=A0A8J3TLD8_9ACTN|nr:TetR family transcriptional regulator [Planotetraspora mira]GII29228.1 TetR family transcriptional regulator [Planotetraspora mira]